MGPIKIFYEHLYDPLRLLTMLCCYDSSSLDQFRYKTDLSSQIRIYWIEISHVKIHRELRKS